MIVEKPDEGVVTKREYQGIVMAVMFGTPGPVLEDDLKGRVATEAHELCVSAGLWELTMAGLLKWNIRGKETVYIRTTPEEKQRILEAISLE